MFNITILFTIITLAFYQFLSTKVSIARGKYKISAPATTGNEIFERVYRTHLNFMENMVIYLPLMWIAGQRFSNNWFFITVASLWLVSKMIFSVAYSEGWAFKIKLGFSIASTLAVIILFVMSIMTLF